MTGGAPRPKALGQNTAGSFETEGIPGGQDQRPKCQAGGISGRWSLALEKLWTLCVQLSGVEGLCGQDPGTSVVLRQRHGRR